jgi:hypothetical protein
MSLQQKKRRGVGDRMLSVRIVFSLFPSQTRYPMKILTSSLALFFAIAISGCATTQVQPATAATAGNACSPAPGGACYAGPGGPAYAGPGGAMYAGPGGARYAGPGGARYAGPGGPFYAGPGGTLYAGPGGNCYAGPGGACGAATDAGTQCPAACKAGIAPAPLAN